MIFQLWPIFARLQQFKHEQLGQLEQVGQLTRDIISVLLTLRNVWEIILKKYFKESVDDFWSIHHYFKLNYSIELKMLSEHLALLFLNLDLKCRFNYFHKLLGFFQHFVFQLKNFTKNFSHKLKHIASTSRSTKLSIERQVTNQ